VLVVLVDIQQLKDTELALEDQRKQLRLVIDNIGVPMSYIDRDLRFRFANTPGLDWNVAKSDEAIGKRIDELFDVETIGIVGPHLQAALKGQKRVYERAVKTASGATRWVRVHLLPDFGPGGEVRGLYTLMLDVDHDHRLREALERQEAQLRQFADNIPDAVAYLDRGRRILFANRHFAEQRKTTPEAIIGRTTAELMGPEVAAWIAERTQKVFDRAELASYERLTDMPDGSQRWLHVKAVPDVAESGEVRGMYVVAHDITEVKQAQAQLAAREEELRFFAENIPEAIVFVDLERGTTFVNNVFLATRGVQRELVLGKFPEDVYPPEVMAKLRPHLEAAARGEESVYERRLRLPGGEQRWVRVRVTPRRDASGRVTGYYVVSTDIHEIKTAHAALEDKERQLRQVIDSIPTPMCYVDAGTRYRYVNDAFLDYIGRPAGQVIGHTVEEVLGPERWAAVVPVLERVRAGESISLERLVQFADGRKRWMTVRLTPRMVDGAYMGYYSTTSDIHEQKTVEEELRRANNVLSAHFDNTPLAVIEFDTRLRLVRWSGHAEAIFGWSGAETLGRPLDAFRHVYEEDRESANAMIRGLVEGRMRHGTLLHRNYRKDGSVIWVEWHHSALRDEGGAVISILSLAQDVSSRIQAEERLQFMATHDGLTSLPNTVLLNDRLEAALARARRARTRVGVMFLDLDHFKDVNDTLGHRVGDALLRELARRVRATLRQTDLLARISGDEFVVVLEDVADDYAPEHVAHKILEEVRRPFLLDGNEIHVSCSLGLALHPEDGADAETLLKNADAAMYHAKELGRNGFRSFSAQLAERRTQRMQVEAALRRALRDDELTLYYQPIMDIATGRVRRAEALLRWRDPERGLVLPQSFVPQAEESGLGHALGSWVLEAACRQARRWRDAGGDLTVCVNLSASQLRDTAMVADLKGILERSACEAGWLQLEITETSMVRDVEGASLVLARLRSLGVRIAIDDFGTGFSSLSHLRHLPVDVLKVDKGFVADIDSSPRAAAREVAGGAAIVSAVIGLARGLGLDVVAEGVEKQSQLDFLAREGCQAAQGYLICPPIPADELERWLATRNSPARKRATSKARKPKVAS
jgi:diguanylate cyclase (GGDEF)-like protein/PAS domain S-box-containing protein